MDIKRISPFLSVSPQIYPAQMAHLATWGFKTIFNNRPDKEKADQPLGVELAVEADKHGMIFVDLPILTTGITERNVVDYGVEIARAYGPVLAFCRSGTRSTTLWARHEARRMDADSIIGFAATIGYDLSSHKDHFVRTAAQYMGPPRQRGNP
jgi:sulfide:quinone oxidoreductase